MTAEVDLCPPYTDTQTHVYTQVPVHIGTSDMRTQGHVYILGHMYTQGHVYICGGHVHTQGHTHTRIHAHIGTCVHTGIHTYIER